MIQEFFTDGLLMYTSRSSGATVVMELTYQVEGDWLVTNQPSHPREDRVQFSIDSVDRLIVREGSEPWIFIRAPGATLMQP
ncbi:MAG: hypothetical protein M3Y05_08490 [Gemmatimonadota bacterium]|nr:hypothetical protein [Gemmatimonadota bacterium]